MNLRTVCCLCYALVLAAPHTPARSLPAGCGTYPGRWREEIDLHNKAERRRASKPGAARAATVPRLDADIGEIAVLENDDSIFGQVNPFDLDRQQIVFTPTPTGYSYAVTDGGFDQTVAGAGDALSGLGDDDTRRYSLPFSFTFYGVTYKEVWLNSDGNLTFGEGDSASSSRSLGRMSAGGPRIAGLFTDMDPTRGSGAVRVTSNAQVFAVSWLRVPEFVDFGTGRAQTVQIRIYPDGKIAMAWDGVGFDEGVVGISPGESPVRITLASFHQTPTGNGAGMIAERFGDVVALDLVAASRRFYETHDDSYDYLAFFNATGVQPGSGVLAFETSVRTNRLGIGDTPTDVARQYGSPHRLQAVLNMGPLNNYPNNPADPSALRFSTGDTGRTLLAHEAGHLFLAFSSIRDPLRPDARPMLGRQLFHWNFRFNSEASILEGNRIRDNGENTNPRFATVATVEGYSPLDQYLMGLRPAEEVPPTFLVENSSLSSAVVDPRVGVSFNGSRRNVTVDDLIAVDGRRIPDHTVEQRRYRIAFVFIVPQGQTASATDLAKLDRYRTDFEASFARFSDNRAAMETTLRRSVRLSIEPAAGVIGGSTLPVELRLQKPAATPLTIALTQQSGGLEGPASVTIPAGESAATVNFRGMKLGVELLRASPLGDSLYMGTEARVNVALAARTLTLRVLAGDRQTATPGVALPEPIVVKLTDANDIPYPNVRLSATGGNVTPASVVTGPDGRVSFRWTPGPDPLNVIQIGVAGSPLPVVEAIALGRPAFASTAVVNAASFRPGITPGGIATIFGANLASPEVTVDGTRAQVFYADDRQINFSVPPLVTAAATVTVRVSTKLGASEPAAVPFLAVQPGIFFDTVTGRAAAIARGGRIFEVYGTGFGNAPGVTGTVGGRAAEILFSGLAPGFIGLQQINVRADAALPAGDQPLTLTAAGVTSNQVLLPIAP